LLGLIAPERFHMKTKRIVRAGIAAAAILFAVLAIAATQEPRRSATQAFMRQKLGYSQSILEGLALEKFDLVSKNALRLRNMTQSNFWVTMKHPDYMLHATNYQRSVEALYTAATDKNLDAATEAYANVARNCVECHRVLRLEQHKRSVLRGK
jgi:mono/diheme cytochrome c family protein